MNPFVALEARIATGEMTARDLMVYGMAMAHAGGTGCVTFEDVGRILGTRRDRHKSARRAVRKLEQLGLMRREHEAGKPVRIVLLLPA